MIERRAVSPWPWADEYNCSQAYQVSGARSFVVLSAQAPLSARGDLVGASDFAAQVRQVFANIGAVLNDAGATFDDVIKLTAYVTDMSNLAEYGRVRTEFLQGRRPAVTTVGVASLALPGILIEVEALAVR